MRQIRTELAAIFLLPALALLAGCENGGHFTIFGYTTKPPFDESIRTVLVPTALNTTYLRGIEFPLTEEVINELGRRSGAPKVTSCRERADSELTLKVVQNRKSTVIFNQLGEPRQVENYLQIEVVWRDLRPGHEGDILSNPKRFDPNELPLPGDPKATPPAPIPLLITPTGTYVPELGGSTATSHQQAIRRAALQIVNMMEVRR